MNILTAILDIGILTFILYKAYELITKTNSMQIIRSAIIIGLIYGIAYVAKLNTLNWILQNITSVLFISIAIVFQPELRKVFLKLGQNEWFSFGNRAKDTSVESVLVAAEELSKLRRGMLVVWMRHSKIDDLKRVGTILNADISAALLVAIFKYDTPLHDGACIIQGKKIFSAGGFLPLSENYEIKKTFGTRHRAALAMASISDAVVLVVSEETGAISLAYDSSLHYDLSMDELRKTLESLLELKRDDKNVKDKIDEHPAII